jgi:serine/threonine protein phosphatase PrpC
MGSVDSSWSTAGLVATGVVGLTTAYMGYSKWNRWSVRKVSVTDLGSDRSVADSYFLKVWSWTKWKFIYLVAPEQRVDVPFSCFINRWREQELDQFDYRVEPNLAAVQRKLLKETKLANEQLNAPCKGLAEGGGQNASVDGWLSWFQTADDRQLSDKVQELAKQSKIRAVGNPPGNNLITATTPTTTSACAYSLGTREYMEDAYSVKELKFNAGDQKAPIVGALSMVIDGHGGEECALYVRQNFAKRFTYWLNRFCRNSFNRVAVWNAFKISFVDLSRRFRILGQGASVNVIARIKDSVWIANVGDCPALVVTRDRTVQRLSEDQNCLNITSTKLTPTRFFKTILRRGGTVVKSGHVPNASNNARAIGDHNSKGATSARPKITMIENEGDRIYVQTTDGVSDEMNASKMGEVAFQGFLGRTPSQIAEVLNIMAIYLGGGDNRTALVTKVDV